MIRLKPSKDRPAKDARTREQLRDELSTALSEVQSLKHRNVGLAETVRRLELAAERPETVALPANYHSDAELLRAVQALCEMGAGAVRPIRHELDALAKRVEAQYPSVVEVDIDEVRAKAREE